ncbi:MAG TPA: outer membrane lipoprotein-sorting protein [Steroidobacteraceae bacterium]|nr:outer membrane lipoprotein-sorting protein [Steroidobacteraceae bacterium]
MRVAAAIFVAAAAATVFAAAQRIAVLPMALAATNPTAEDVVSATDRVRNPGEPFRVTVTLTEYVGGAERSHDRLIVFSKEDRATRQFRNLIEYVEPPRDYGKKVLLDGQSLWFFDPASNLSIRISAQQRLIGQAAIGDVLTVNLAADYAPAVVGAETIQDATRKERTCWHLDLKAANSLAVYARVEYWVEQGTNYPIKGKFYSDSGRLLKILYYRAFSEQLGGIRPTEAVIIDAVDTSLATTVSFGDYRSQDIPEAWFQRDYLPHLKIP